MTTPIKVFINYHVELFGLDLGAAVQLGIVTGIIMAKRHPEYAQALLAFYDDPAFQELGGGHLATNERLVNDIVSHCPMEAVAEKPNGPSEDGQAV